MPNLAEISNYHLSEVAVKFFQKAYRFELSIGAGVFSMLQMKAILQIAKLVGKLSFVPSSWRKWKVAVLCCAMCNDLVGSK